LPTKTRRVRIPSSAPSALAARRSCGCLVSGWRRFDSDRGLDRATPSSNGSGSEITNLRMTVRVRPESRIWAVIWDQIGFQVRSAGFDPSTACARQAAHLVVRSVSYAERAGFDPLACYFEVWLNLVRARGSGPRDWWFESTHLDEDTASSSPGGDRSPTNCMRRVRFPGSYELVPLAQRKCSRPISDRRRFESFTEHDQHDRSWCA
jgi:hypothetical protein